MKLLVTGAQGMLGVDLIEQLSDRYDVVGIDIDKVDIREQMVTGFIVREKPAFVFHLAAYTQVDRAEEEREVAQRVNVDGTQNVIKACKIMDIPLLFISTDYVFDGSKEHPYKEIDVPHPINVYGTTKYEAEKLIVNQLARWFIVRTSWLFGVHGKNFVDTIHRLAFAQEHIRVVNDQRGNPTYTGDLARALEYFIGDSSYGIYHVTNGGSCTWFDFAKEIVSLTEAPAQVHPVSSQERKKTARRPAFSVLDTGLFEEHFGYRMPTWQDGLRRYLQRKGIKEGSEP